MGMNGTGSVRILKIDSSIARVCICPDELGYGVETSDPPKPQGPSSRCYFSPALLTHRGSSGRVALRFPHRGIQADRDVTVRTPVITVSEEKLAFALRAPRKVTQVTSCHRAMPRSRRGGR